MTQIYGAIDSLGTAVALRADELTSALIGIDYAHHEVHDGSMFVVSHVDDAAGSADVDIHVKTPNSTKYAHIVPQIVTEGEAHIYIYEEPTLTDDGTALTAYNRNRASSKTATVLVYHTPTASADGTLIFEQHWGAGKSNGAESRDIWEFILKANTSYIFRVTNATASANQISINLDWYEHG